MAPLAKKMGKYPFFKKMGNSSNEKFVRYTKYLVLITLVFLTTALVGFMFTDLCPVGFLTGTIPLLILHPTRFIPNAFFPIALAIFILFVILIALVGRGWCRYVCPLGALMAPFNKVSAIRVDVDRDKCIECMACVKTCPMKIEVLNMYRDPECILCGKCIQICPTSAIKYKVT
jgi:polyferredoxin